MKRVSFKVAKALKEAGYNEPCDMYYHIYDDSDIVDGEYESQMSLEATGDGCQSFLNALNHYRCAAPYAFEVWLWLEKDKGTIIHPDSTYVEDGTVKYATITHLDQEDFHSVGSKFKYDSSEEAIIAAIEYLVDNNLLK